MIILILIVSLAIVILLLNTKKTPKKSIVGTWTTDGVTTYKFNNDNTGRLIVSLAEYEFTYKITDNKLDIDFKNEKFTDPQYTYYFEDHKLVLNGDNGTFTFIKK